MEHGVYRVELFDSARRLKRVVQLDAPDDVEAMRQLAPFRGLVAMTLWQGPHQVAHWEMDPP